MRFRQHSKPVIYVRSRLDAERVIPRPDEVCISITNPRQAPAVLDGWSDVLRLGFHDVEGPAGHYREMSAEHAAQVLAFARKHRNRTILVHCEWGASRSAAVALFLAAWLNRPLDGDDELANQWVLQTMAVAGRHRALRWMDLRLAAVSTWGPRGALRPMPFASTRNPLQD
jgi:predicted protein tyrosine phosphatase